MLEKFRQAKAGEIQALRALAEAGAMPAAYAGFRPSFSEALRRGRGTAGIAVIAEYKRASPSKGVINEALTPEAAADGYARAGAAALSVLTEERYFQGSLAFLTRMAGCGLPLLRKDFLLDPLHVVQTAATPASALLLIVRMFEDAEGLAELFQAATKAGIESVVEIFDNRDLNVAREAGARIIQVNNRDLDTLKTDFAVSQTLIGRRAAEELWISASGVGAPEDLRMVRDWGFDAALVGTSLMAGGDAGAALASLLGGMER